MASAPSIRVRVSVVREDEVALLLDGMAAAWGIIANATGWYPGMTKETDGSITYGDTTDAEKAWARAAERWRDEVYYPALARNDLYPDEENDVDRPGVPEPTPPGPVRKRYYLPDDTHAPLVARLARVLGGDWFNAQQTVRIVLRALADDPELTQASFPGDGETWGWRECLWNLGAQADGQ